MTFAIRFHESRNGRVALLEAPNLAALPVHDGPSVLARAEGPDCQYEVAGKPAPCGDADLLLVNPGEAMRCECPQDGAPARLLSIQLSPEWARERFPAVFEAGAQPFPRTREPITPRIRRLADAMAVELLNDQFLAPERLEFMVQEMVLSVVDTYIAKRRATSPVWRGSRFADARIRDAIALLRAKPNKEMNMDVVASKVGLSRSRFYDLFQVCTGLSPRDYLDKLCVETAIGRLASSQMKIADVSADLGFSAQSNFTRFFLHQVGIPPSEYRRAALRGTAGT